MHPAAGQLCSGCTCTNKQGASCSCLHYYTTQRSPISCTRAPTATPSRVQTQIHCHASSKPNGTLCNPQDTPQSFLPLPWLTTTSQYTTKTVAGAGTTHAAAAPKTRHVGTYAACLLDPPELCLAGIFHTEEGCQAHNGPSILNRVAISHLVCRNLTVLWGLKQATCNTGRATPPGSSTGGVNYGGQHGLVRCIPG